MAAILLFASSLFIPSVLSGFSLPIISAAIVAYARHRVGAIGFDALPTRVIGRSCLPRIQYPVGTS